MTHARLVVAGVGLLGGSAALALRRAGLVDEVVGVGRSEANLSTARALGIVDRFHRFDGAWQAELRTAAYVLVAAPVGQFRGIFAALAGHVGPDTVLTDAGSTKVEVIAAARDTLGAAFARYVPAHPIAGGELSGAAAARADLFEHREVIVTPHGRLQPDALQRADAMWRACGARIVTMTPEAHDTAYAAVSHLPHFVSAAYLAGLGQRASGPAMLARAGTGFRDFTRIGASDPEVWRDIALTNREAIRAELAVLSRELAAVDRALASADAASIEALFALAQSTRSAWATAKGETP